MRITAQLSPLLARIHPSNAILFHSASPFVDSISPIATMTKSSTSDGGAFKTIKEKVALESEIKKSKFIAIAGPISKEQSAPALSFLSQVKDPGATHNCWAYKSFQVEDIKQDYDTGKDGTTMVTFKVDYDKVDDLEESIRANCARDIILYKQ